MHSVASNVKLEVEESARRGEKIDVCTPQPVSRLTECSLDCVRFMSMSAGVQCPSRSFENDLIRPDKRIAKVFHVTRLLRATQRLRRPGRRCGDEVQSSENRL